MGFLRTIGFGGWGVGCQAKFEMGTINIDRLYVHLRTITAYIDMFMGACGVIITIRYSLYNCEIIFL